MTPISNRKDNVNIYKLRELNEEHILPGVSHEACEDKSVT